MTEGHIVYHGEASTSHLYFSRIGFTCPQYTNPQDYYMKVISASYSIKGHDSKRIEYLKDKYEDLLFPVNQREA